MCAASFQIPSKRCPRGYEIKTPSSRQGEGVLLSEQFAVNDLRRFALGHCFFTQVLQLRRDFTSEEAHALFALLVGHAAITEHASE